MATKSRFRVEVDTPTGKEIRQVTATSKASACRTVFKMLIRDGKLVKSPRSVDGWWDGVSCSSI